MKYDIEKQQSELEKKEIEIKRLAKQSREFDKQAQRYFEIIVELEKRIKQLGKCQHTLMQSRRKWKNRYYKQRKKARQLEK